MKMKKYIFTIITLLLLISFTTGCSNTTIAEDNEHMKTVLSYDEFQLLYPASYDLELAKEKSLVKKEINEEQYRKCQASYMQVFNAFLNEAAHIDQYQKELDESALNFPAKNVNVYCSYGSFGRQNISLRNTFFVERLSTDEISRFVDAMDADGNVAVSDELLKIVEATWKDVIVVNFEEASEQPYRIVYDPTALGKIDAMNDAVVLQINFSTEYDANGNIPDDDYETEKYNTIKDLATRMETEIASELGHNVDVLIVTGE